AGKPEQPHRRPRFGPSQLVLGCCLKSRPDQLTVENVGAPARARILNARWIPASISIPVVASVLALLGYTCWQLVLSDMHRNIVPGIWLTLATDLANGVLY